MAYLSISVEGGLLSPDFLETIHDAAGQRPADFGLDGRRSLVDEVSAVWGDVRAYWTAFERRLARASGGRGESTTTITREQWVIPLLEALGYAITYQRRAAEVDGRTYAISHRAGQDEDAPPVHIVAVEQPLGSRPPAGRGTMSPHALLQDYLNRSDDHLWGIVTNGHIFRLLRDSTYFTRPTYIEFDLRQMLAGERLDEFIVFYRLVQRTRLPDPGGLPSDCLLETYHQQALEQGGRIRDGLRVAVSDALLTLGNGFLRHPRNAELQARVRDGKLSAGAYYQQLLYLIYRLLFLMVAEGRNLLVHGDDVAHRVYYQFYSIERLRVLADTPMTAPGRFDDLYLSLQALFELLRDEKLGVQLGLPPLNGRLFSPDSTPDVGRAYLNNQDLLYAIRSLSYFTPPDEKVRRRVNYAALDVEELGSVYESLLDEQPVLKGLQGANGTQDASLSFSFVTGTERKTTGSYYTPRELVNEVIKSALMPMIADRLEAAGKDQEARQRALLDLRVCDPACGSGHFLLAAARRIGRELARVRTGDEEPAPDHVRAATRDAIIHCIYGVDKNPLAVDLCKVALWIEGHSRGKPLTLLDQHILRGDSLVGVMDMTVLEEGIPDAAFDPVTGDDKQIARALKVQNRQEREGQFTLFREVKGTERSYASEDWQALQDMPEDTPEQVQKKQMAYEQLRAQTEPRRMAANIWTAAFFNYFTDENVDTGRVITTDALRRFLINPRDIDGQLAGAVYSSGEEFGFFHWPLEYPHVFANGGFDVVVGNPPWEQLQPEEIRFFSMKGAPAIAALTGAKRKSAIAKLPQTNPELSEAWQTHKRDIKSVGRFVRCSERYQRTAVGKLNTYSLFAELVKGLISSNGAAGIVLPIGIVTDYFTRHFFVELMETGQLAQVIGFENEAFIFPAVHNEFKFCILSINGESMPREVADLVFFCRYFSDIREEKRHFKLSLNDLSIMNPNTMTCPVFRTTADAELTRKVYTNLPILCNEELGENPWGIALQQGLFNMTGDSDLFRDRTFFAQQGSTLRGNVYVMNDGECFLPLYEAKMIWQFDHRFASFVGTSVNNRPSRKYKGWYGVDATDPGDSPIPRYWVPASEVSARLDPKWENEWLLGFRRITSAVVERTMVTAIIPRFGASDVLPVCLGLPNSISASLLLANFNSLCFDYVARQKIGGAHMDFHYLKQMPIVPPECFSKQDFHFIVPRVLDLVYTAWDVASFARDVWQEANDSLREAIQHQRDTGLQITGGHPGHLDSSEVPFPPFKWDEERRAQIRAELDAYYARLYGLTRDELRYILDPADIYGPDFPGETFRVLKEKEIKEYGEYRTQRLVLAAWDEQQRAIDRGEMQVGVPDAAEDAMVAATIAEHLSEHTTAPAETVHLKKKQLAIPAVILPDVSAILAEPYARRLSHVNELGRQITMASTVQLVALLDDDNDTTRWLIGVILANRGGLNTIAALTAYLAERSDGPKRDEALKILEQIAENPKQEKDVRAAARHLLADTSDEH